MTETPEKQSAAIAVWFCTSKCSIKDQNGVRSHKKRKHQEAASACQHLTQFTIKDYPQLLAKLTETQWAEGCLYLHGFKCGVYANGKYAAESTRQSTETYPKP